jgi:drug/metabolite transporter (DMT)-like permease
MAAPTLTDPSAERQALAFALIAVALWSTVATGFKLGLRVLEPVQLLFLGSAISCLFFVAALLASGQLPNLARTPRKALTRYAALGLMNPFCYYLILFEAYDRLPAQIAQPLNYTWAITLAVLAWPILGQRLTARVLTGILISYLGVLVLLTQGRWDKVPDVDGFGVALALVSTLIWASYWLLGTKNRASALVVMTPGFVIGTLGVTAVCATTTGLPALNGEALLYGAWVGLIEMGVTFLLWQTALARTHNAGRIGQLIFLSPFVSLILINFVLGEHVHLASVVGLGGIVAGLAISRR